MFEPDLLVVGDPSHTTARGVEDPDGKSVECYRLESGGYRLVAEGEGDTMLDYPDWEGFVIDLAGLWSLSQFS